MVDLSKEIVNKTLSLKIRLPDSSKKLTEKKLRLANNYLLRVSTFSITATIIRRVWD